MDVHKTKKFKSFVITKILTRKPNPNGKTDG